MEHPATDAQRSQHRRSLKAVTMGCAHTSVTDYPVTDDQHMSLGGRRLSNVPSPLPSDWTPPPPASFSIASAGPQPNTAATIAGVVIGKLYDSACFCSHTSNSQSTSQFKHRSPIQCFLFQNQIILFLDTLIQKIMFR